MSDDHTPGQPQTGARPYEEFTVPVAGGDLAVLRWPADDPDAPVVVALHGITANGLSWARVAHHLAGRVTLLAPDLRGRAHSRTLPGPYGIDVHAQDVTALIKASGAQRLVLAGHSMGGFVATLAAVQNPGSVTSVLLVDGGVPFPVPQGLATDQLLAAVIGPAMQRLSMAFPDRAAYSAFWRDHHPSFTETWSPWADAYIQRDLVGTEPEMRSSCQIEAIRTDGAALFTPEILEAFRELPCPATLLWAERGIMNQPQGLYDEQRLAAVGVEHSTVEPLYVAGTNHFSVLIGDEGARLIAEHLLQAADVDATVG